MTRTAEHSELLTPREIADRLGLPVATIYQWRSRGDGPPGFRAGRHVRYRRSDFEHWIDEQISRGRRHHA